jgi:hypothetical protein
LTESVCHCGAVRIVVPFPPEQVTDCNCSICRRLGALWAYYSPAQVTITGLEATAAYVRHDGPDMGQIAFHHCRTCGCATHWSAVDPTHDRMGVNTRLMDPKVVATARVRRIDGADTWEELDG